MDDSLSEHFSKYPSQQKVARLMLKHGLRVAKGKAWCGEVEISDTSLGRATGVDRRVVKATVETIESNPKLRKLFSSLRPTALLVDTAPIMGWSSIEIIPDDPHEPGILADVAGVMSDSGISIRQALVDDPELSEEPRLYVITESQVPPTLIPKIKSCKGVRSIIIH